MTFVKICGLRTIEHALAAVASGADLLGFIFAPSRRQVSPEDVVTIAAAVRAASLSSARQVDLVGVFVNETPRRILEIAEQCDLDAIQLSGDEHPSMRDQLPNRTLIKAIRLNRAAIELSWLHGAPSLSTRFLVDAQVPGAYGGAGVLADWDGAADLARQHQLLLAGGLTPENVGAAIRRVRPWGVDVSSGVETNGVKDATKIRAFIAAARVADNQIESA
jgi:phosphoribosylanthranilate isomerase